MVQEAKSITRALVELSALSVDFASRLLPRVRPLSGRLTPPRSHFFIRKHATCHTHRKQRE